MRSTKYQVGTVQNKHPTDQEIEQARAHVTKEHMRALREELPYAKRYFETTLSEMDLREEDGLSESSTGSYEV